MQDSNLLMYVAGELAILLLAVCIFLCFHVTNLKKLIGKLEEKITSLRKSVSLARKETRAAQGLLAEQQSIVPKAFLDYLDEEIELTLEHHQSLNPDRDIVLDIAPDTPIERQASSLRHAFLIAEKEARYAGDENQSNWEMLQAKLQQIIQFFAPPAPEQTDESPDTDDFNARETENYKKQIENLERYKKLFLETEDKWHEAKARAEQYYEQLMAKGKDLGGDEEFEALLNNYSHAFDGIEAMISDRTSAEDDAGVDVNEQLSNNGAVGKMVIANQEEMQRLKNMAVDQHKVITELKRKLLDAQSPEQQQEAIEQLSQQLEQQQRFLKEAETCTQLIEDELSRAMVENEQLRSELDGQSGRVAKAFEMETLVEELTGESKQMLRTIAALEQENQSLKQELQSAASGESAHNAAQLQEKLTEMQQELLNMQTQHIELEERYLELKMASS